MLAKSIIASTLLTAVMGFDQYLQVRQLDSSASELLASASAAIASGTAALASATSLAAQCTVPASVLSVLETVPTPPADLTITACSQTFTGAQEAEYTSYTSVLSSWYKANQDIIDPFESSFTKNCPLATGLSICGTTATSGSAATGTGKSGSATGTGSSGSATGTGSSGSAATGSAASGAAAPQNTFMAVAAGAIAGAIGLVAAL